MSRKLRNLFTSLVLMGLITAGVAGQAAFGSASEEAQAVIGAVNANAEVTVAEAAMAPAGYAETAAAKELTASAAGDWAAGAREAASTHAPPGVIAGAIVNAGLNA